jgi:hypothetical protein
MDPTELGDRIVAVLEEHPLIEILGPAMVDEWVGTAETFGQSFDTGIGVVYELVQKQPSNRLGRPGVAGEECPFHYFRKVDQGEHRAVDVGKKPCQDCGFGRAERFFEVGHRSSECTGKDPRHG